MKSSVLLVGVLCMTGLVAQPALATVEDDSKVCADVSGKPAAARGAIALATAWLREGFSREPA